MHLVQPRLVPVALVAGMTTLIIGGLNDNATFDLERMFMAFAARPTNLGILAGAASLTAAPLPRQTEAGACGLKVHEDYAGYSAIIDRALTVADTHDIQVAMHTDRLSESCELREIELAAIGIINSDSQGMGRIGEVVRRTRQLAPQMELARGDDPPDDNARSLPHLAKHTINTAPRPRGRGPGQLARTGEACRSRSLPAGVLRRDARPRDPRGLSRLGGSRRWKASVAQAEPVLYSAHWGGVGRAGRAWASTSCLPLRPRVASAGGSAPDGLWPRSPTRTCRSTVATS